MSVILEHIYHTYGAHTPFESHALEDVSVEISKGEMVGLIGHTGSGKSTLVQHLNALLKPTQGRIWIDGQDITAPGISLQAVRKKVGLVFQYAEYQLFEETVEKDIAFGPINLGFDPAQVQKSVQEAMEYTGLDYERYRGRSPFALSGGQRRRVAIAGVLAMNPQVLVLDEPTAGLDPAGREEILGKIAALHRSIGNTVILVSHSMEEVSRYVDRLVVMEKGRIALTGTPAEVFEHGQALRAMGLSVPEVVKLREQLRQKGWEIPSEVLTVQDMLQFILARKEAEGA